MIVASRNGLTVNIEKTPVPPQVWLSAKTLKPSLKHHTSFDAAIKGRSNKVSVKVSIFFSCISRKHDYEYFHGDCSSASGTPIEVFATMERDLIYQVKLCEECRLTFTQLVFAQLSLKIFSPYIS